MNLELPAAPESLTHGYLFVGPRAALEEEIGTYLNAILPEWAGTDGLFLSVDTLYIEQARDVVARVQLKAAASRRFFVLSFDGATTEAQNALLKVFEEPPEGSHFFLIVPASETILPTLRSRLILHRLHVDDTAPVSAAAFIAANQKERQAIIAPIIEKKDKRSARRLLEDIEKTLYRAYRKGTVGPSALRDIEMTRGYIADRSASIKMLLEYMSVSVPKLKL